GAVRECDLPFEVEHAGGGGVADDPAAGVGRHPLVLDAPLRAVGPVAVLDDGGGRVNDEGAGRVPHVEPDGGALQVNRCSRHSESGGEGHGVVPFDIQHGGFSLRVLGCSNEDVRGDLGGGDRVDCDG